MHSAATKVRRWCERICAGFGDATLSDWPNCDLSYVNGECTNCARWRGNAMDIGEPQHNLENYCSQGRTQWGYVQLGYVGSNQM
jgi:hypothetical protein